ncbi:MAG: UDP-4-amino-4,6-dideoxy-N-acetyl-beta-L-altrosamine transaminase [Candidatus Omnitrophica bacterium]|nr:UDP-4-amino-4,6-dideoxy-N-acetyl-beta-L-altrosamine transaminase [Candidatus Omnitrophota bacterium]
MPNRKFIPYSRQSVDSDDLKAVNSVLHSDWLTQGPKVSEFENRLSSYCNAQYAVAVSSGTAALHIACLAAGIEPCNEVITSPLTFVASANCVLYCGARPVFADIQQDSANIEPVNIKKNINRKTKALIPVHFAGHPCDLGEINKIRKKHNLIVIEDATHALGADYVGAKIGSCKYSDMSVFSFHPVKPITTGEGGAVLTNRKDLYERLLLLRSHGITKERRKFSVKNTKSIGVWFYEMQELGFNYRITDFQCALGISQLKKLDRFIKRRREIVEKYRKLFLDNDYFDLPIEGKGVKSSWHLYPIRLKNKYISKKSLIFDELRKNRIGVQVHYIPVYWHPYYRKLGYKKGLCPKAEEFYQREISIPLHQGMSDKDIKYTVRIIFDVFNKIKSC